jgi:hypothetical protein
MIAEALFACASQNQLCCDTGSQTISLVFDHQIFALQLTRRHKILLEIYDLALSKRQTSLLEENRLPFPKQTCGL